MSSFSDLGSLLDLNSSQFIEEEGVSLELEERQAEEEDDMSQYDVMPLKSRQ